MIKTQTLDQQDEADKERITDRNVLYFIIMPEEELYDYMTRRRGQMNGAEIMKNAMDEFKDIQEYMEIAREENAVKTYAKLKKKYLYLKALLNSLGVNLADIDDIKE